MGNAMQHGKSQDATYQAHLLLIEAVHFPALLVFAERFFKTRSLMSEWLRGALQSIRPGIDVKTSPDVRSDE